MRAAQRDVEGEKEGGGRSVCERVILLDSARRWAGNEAEDTH